MSHTLKTLLKVSLAAASLSVVVGCASQARDDMDARIDEAMTTASEAQTTAEAAMDSADEAQATADQALSTARSAQATADQNSKKIDRMFKKSMYK